MTDRGDSPPVLDPEHRLRRYRATIESLSEGVVHVDDEGRVEFLNSKAAALTGWDPEFARGSPFKAVCSLLDPDTREPILDPVTTARRRGGPQTEEGRGMITSDDGTEHVVRWSAIRLTPDEGGGTIVILDDVTTGYHAEKELRNVTNFDPLTGLANRRAFEDHLQRALAVGEPETHLLCIDLDHFRLVNETAGYAAGDRVLAAAASLLKTFFPESCTVARLEADVFAALVENVPWPVVEQQASRLTKQFEEFDFDPDGLRLHASIGIVRVEARTGDPRRVLRAAIAACEKAKREGGNRVHVSDLGDPALAQTLGDSRWVSRLQSALLEDRLRLVTQPIRPLVSAGSRPPMHEVLVRLQDEHGNLHRPAAFVPAAEQYRIVEELDRVVVGKVLDHMSDHDSAERFSINLSGQSLGSSGFLEFLRSRLATSGVEPERICFEVTETAAIARLDDVRRLMVELRSKGCRFAIDDFGTGVSSFAYLRNLPVQYLKIDGAFVQRMTVDPIQNALVQSINHIGHLLGLITIAESVETSELERELTEMQVDYAQGYWIGPPVPLGE